MPIYCILPKRCVVKEIFISEWRIGDVHVNSDTLKESYNKQPKGKAVGVDGITKAEMFVLKASMTYGAVVLMVICSENRFVLIWMI